MSKFQSDSFQPQKSPGILLGKCLAFFKKRPKKTALKHVYYQVSNRSPVQVGCMRQVLRGWCTGKTQGDGMGREAGGGIGMGNTCKSMADSCHCMAKTTTIL